LTQSAFGIVCGQDRAFFPFPTRFLELLITFGFPLFVPLLGPMKNRGILFPLKDLYNMSQSSAKAWMAYDLLLEEDQACDFLISICSHEGRPIVGRVRVSTPARLAISSRLSGLKKYLVTAPR